MWEEAGMPPQATAPRKKKNRKRPKSEENLVLWGQILLCLAIVGLAACARYLQWPILPRVRTAFEAALQPEQGLFLAQGRGLAKFTEEAAETFSAKVSGLWAEIQAGDAAPARAAHGKEKPVPSGAREESYLPDFSLCYPLPGSRDSRTSGYGWRTDPMGGSGSDFHLGNDLAAAEGTVIYAAADGVVRSAGVHNSYGNYVRVLHADGDETLYAHMQYIFVRSGQPVRAGEVLGTVGETGNATGPHLHFEILHQGIRYDPSRALQTAS